MTCFLLALHWMQEGTEKHGLINAEAVMICRRIHLCHLQMYTLTHTSIHLTPPSGLSLFSIRGKKTKKQKAVIGQHTRSKRTIWTNRMRQKLCQESRQDFQHSLHLCSLETSPELQVKGNGLTLHPNRGQSKAVSCPDCPDRCRMSWCRSQSHHRCPLAGTFPASASGWLWDGSTDPGSQNDLSSPQKDPARNRTKYINLTRTKKGRNRTFRIFNQTKVPSTKTEKLKWLICYLIIYTPPFIIWGPLKETNSLIQQECWK